MTQVNPLSYSANLSDGNVGENEIAKIPIPMAALNVGDRKRAREEGEGGRESGARMIKRDLNCHHVTNIGVVIFSRNLCSIHSFADVEGF